MPPNECAAFRPFPPDIIVDETVKTIPNFEFATRITCDSIDLMAREDLASLVHHWVVKLGRPLVIEGFQDRLDTGLFSSEWLQENYGKKGKRSPHDFVGRPGPPLTSIFQLRMSET
jgi:hypothetical protein